MQETNDLTKETDHRRKNKYPQKDQTEHLFRKAPGNFTWDVIPGVQ